MLLSLTGPKAIDSYLENHDLKAFTSHTITDKTRMRDWLAQIERQGWVISEQQLELSYRGVAVPLRDHKGNVVASLSVSMPMGHESTQEACERVLPVLREVAQSLRSLI
jgi:IclR family pca regulon transcriptional regulator